MSRYRRAQVPGATYFFTVNLLNRRSDLLVRHIDLLRDTVRATRSRHGLGTALRGVLLEQRWSKRHRSQAHGLIQGKDFLANFGYSKIAFYWSMWQQSHPTPHARKNHNRREDVMNGKTLYKITQEIVEDTEDLLLNTKLKLLPARWVHRQALAPIKLLFLGSAEVFRPLTKWAFMAIASLLLGTLFIQTTEIPIEHAQAVLLFLMYAPIILVMFAVPSTYTFSDLKPHQIVGVSRIITSKLIDSEDKLKLFEKNLEAIENRTTERVRSFKWLIGSFWAASLFFLTQINSFTLKSKNFDLNKTLQDNMSFLVTAMMITIISLWITTSYKRATEAIFKSIKYSICEIKLHLSDTEHNKDPLDTPQK